MPGDAQEARFIFLAIAVSITTFTFTEIIFISHGSPLNQPPIFGQIQVGGHGISWRNVAFILIYFAQRHCIIIAGGYTQTAADTPVRIDMGSILHGDGIHLASIRTDFARGAEIFIHFSNPVGGHHFGRLIQRFEVLQDLTTTTATQADIGRFPGIARLQNQPGLQSLV